MMKKLLITSFLVSILFYACSPSIEDLHKSGDKKYQLNDFNGAILDYTKAIEIDSAYSKSFYMRGLCKQALMDNDSAFLDFNKAIAIDSTKYNYYLKRGRIRVSVRQLKLAIKDFNKSIELEPESSNSYVERGAVKNSLGDKRGALLDFEKAISLNPKNANAYFERGLLYLEYVDYKNIMRVVKKNNGNNYYIYSNENIYYNISGAFVNFSKAIEIAPSDPKLYFYSGLLKSKVIRYKFYSTLPRHLNKEFEEVWDSQLLDVSYFDLNGSIVDYSIAIELDSKNSNYYYSLFS